MVQKTSDMQRRHHGAFRAVAALIALCLVVFSLTTSAASRPEKAFATDEDATASLAQATGDSQAAVKASGKKLSKYEKAAKKRKAKKRPRIAIVNKNGTRGLASWFKHVGCDTVLITKTSSINPKKYDGLALPGGGDVTPKFYHAKRHPRTYDCNAANDRLQIAAVKKFKKAGKPVLGVCRGAQVVNVALGGTLNQHMKEGRHRGRLKVKIAEGSWLYKTYGASERVWHNHHQCAKKLGKGLVATQWSLKGKRIEGFEHETLPIYGVQWHPESMGAKGRKVAKLFKKVCLESM